MEKYLELLLLKELKGFGPVKINTEYLPNLRNINGINELCDLVCSYEKKVSRTDIDEALKSAELTYNSVCSDNSIQVITALDDNYPSGLLSLKTKKPLILYIRGEASVLEKPGIGVVGTRHPSDRTIKAGPSIVRTIHNIYDCAIVSGLALGCDEIAHEAALDNNMSTIAVMPSGLNVITPSQHKSLADRILQAGGCLISEYEPNEQAQKSTFVRRDALIAAMTEGVIVLECGIKSGTMHTVYEAVCIKRPVACFYPDGADSNFAGCRYILEEKNGHKIVKPSDISQFLSEAFIKKNHIDDNLEQISLFDITTATMSN